MKGKEMRRKGKEPKIDQQVVKAESAN